MILSYEYLNQVVAFIDRGIPTGDDGYPIKSFKDTFFGDLDRKLFDS